MRRESHADRCRGTRARSAFYRTTQALSAELSDVAWATYRVGDEVLRGIVDVTFDVARLAVPQMLTRASKWTLQAQDTAAVFGTGFDLVCTQARNNFEVYSLVKNVRTRLNLNVDGPFDLAAMVEAAYGLGAYADLWAVEGLGHDYAAMCLDRLGIQSAILREGPAAALPPRSLLMMHAGLGLALAERTVRRLTPYSPEQQFRDAASRFVAACAAHARDSYVAAAYESLGLVVRTWYPQLVSGIDKALLELDTDIAGCFWHGVGRALYFLPTYIVPGILSPWRAADQEAPHDLAQQNLYAGLAWATTLVNIRQPRIMANLLAVRGDALARSPGFVNGIASAIVAGIDTTPGDVHILSFASYDAAGMGAAAADRWCRVVRPAVVAALERYHPLLVRVGQLDLVFRYTDLETAMSRLQCGEAASPTNPRVERRQDHPPIGRGGEQPGVYPGSGTSRRREMDGIR